MWVQGVSAAPLRLPYLHPLLIRRLVLLRLYLVFIFYQSRGGRLGALCWPVDGRVDIEVDWGFEELKLAEQASGGYNVF